MREGKISVGEVGGGGFKSLPRDRLGLIEEMTGYVLQLPSYDK